MAKKILLIEYEPRYLDRIRGYLAGKDFDLVVAKDGEEGLEAYKRGRPDVVLISTVLPKLRTRDVIRGMQGFGSTPPILLMTSGYKGKNKAADAQREGATGILEKPFSEEVLLAELGSALGARAAEPFPAASSAGAPLLSSEDIFSDVLSGVEDEVLPRVQSAAAAPPSTDPGISKKLEQTLSGILPRPTKSQSGVSAASGVRPAVEPAKPAQAAAKPVPAPMPTPAPAPPPEPPPALPSDRTLRVEIPFDAITSGLTPAPGAAPKSPSAERSASRTDFEVDRMLTQTLSGLKVKAAEKPAEKAPERPPERPPEKPVERPVEKPVEKPIERAVERPTGPQPRPSAVRPPAPEPAPAAPPVAPRPEPRPEPRPAPAPAPAPERRRPEAAPPPTGGFGRYQLLEKIAAGGMAEVYKARMRGEEGFEKIVAIKRILPHMADNDDFITMFIDEAKLAAQLTHNNIIHIYDLGKVEQYHYIAMEFVDGKDLRSILKLGQERDFPLPVELALFVASKIANALDYAHRRVGLDGKELNLVHRDVSPQNILISFEGDIKLCDFGIAKAATKVSQTQTGALKGKLQYMSPEQAWGKKIDRRTDIFSLGIVLAEMLTGERVFNGDTDLTILEQVRDARVSAPSAKNPEISPRIDQVVLKALAKDPKDRYQNASEFEKDINSVLYSFQPAPGPADLAIHMHRLLEASPSASDDTIDAAFASVEAAPMPEAPKKGKGLVISKRPAVPEKPAAPVAPKPEPIEVSAPDLAVAAEAGKSRTGLFVGIGVAVIALIVAGVLMTRKGGEAPAKGPVPATAATTAATPVAGPTPEPQRVLDPKAVEEEARRIMAEEAKKLREAAAKGAAEAKPTAAAPAAVPAPVGLAPASPLQPPKPAATAPPPTAAPVPTAVPTPVPPKPTEVPVKVAEAAPPKAVEQPRAAEAAPAALKEGDLVGPGEGVVEPKIVKLGAFAGLPPQARQIQVKRGEQGIGSPLILALISETGAVSDARIVKPSSYKFVDDAAMAALRGAQITPATKNGVRVKMWKTFSITVKP